MDYGKLAQLSSPGTSPLGSGIVDPLGYQRWMNLNDMNQQALKQSIPLADMDLQKSQQAHKEYMSGASGRENLVTLGNMNAAAKVKNFDRDQELEALGIDVKKQEHLTKLNDVASQLGSDADAYYKALETNDEQLKKQIVEKNRGRRINNYVIGSDSERDHAIFKIGAIGRQNKPELQNKLAVAGTNAAARVSLENIKLLNDKQRITLRGELARQLQNERLAAEEKRDKNKPLNISQALAQHLDLKYGGDTDGWLKAYTLIEEAKTTLNIDQKEAVLRIFPELAAKIGGSVSPRELPPADVNAKDKGKSTTSEAPTSANIPKGKKPMSVTEALSKLNEAKGTPNEEKMVKAFVDLYGTASLPDWVKKK